MMNKRGQDDRKKSVGKNKLVKATSSKRSKKISSKPKKTAKGEKYSCEVCGLVVSVDHECSCVEICDIICCGEQMVQKR